ncbi:MULTISPECIES: hypothetical protein [Anaeromyxobacter]|uniref:hypothetical protein n=1 Tax=Anaeromyxobacter TaxID=161492 RepID=UPI001F5A16D4|nr:MULTISPECIES: hypothetical protein [unclassified Anaeromyxobacter]
MRALIAAALAAYLALTAIAPHVHLEDPGSGGHPCAVCVSRIGDVATRATPELRPSPLVTGEVILPPGLPPLAGAPLGAVPGQSPPVPA